MDELNRPGRPKGTPKSGGRKKGTPNKASKTFSDVLSAKQFSIPEKAVDLFETTADANLKFKILQFLAEYSHAKVKEADSSLVKDDQKDVAASPLGDVPTEELLKLVKGGAVEST